MTASREKSSMEDMRAEPAWATAERAAARSGVRIRPLHDLEDLHRVVDVVDRIWKPAGGEPLLTIELLRALSHAGNYVVGAFDGPEMVGACVGFLGGSPDVALHSHIAGVSASARGRSIGFALKVHQRAWAIERGLDRISWTADPLVRRNAHFNLVKLAALPVEYFVDFYGEIDDAINAGQGTDRILLRWDLLSPQVVAACEGRRPDRPNPALDGAMPALIETASGTPQRISGTALGDATTRLVAVPADIESLRRVDATLAREWREAVREVLGGLLRTGWRVTGFAAPGWYVVGKDEL